MSGLRPGEAYAADRARVKALADGAPGADGVPLLQLHDRLALTHVLDLLEIAEEPDAWKGGDDRPLPEDDAIEEAFPTNSGRHDLYGEAMRLVGARYSKGGLVALVTWLLLRIEQAGLRPSETSADEAAEDTLVRLGQCPQRGCELAAGHHGEHFARPPFKHLDERAIERARALLLENDRLRAEVEALRELRCGDDIRAPNPQAAAQACSAAETPGAAPPRDCGEDDDDDGWTVNGRPVAPRDVDHGNESENPWTVNGAPIPAAFDHAECRAKLELERERYRRALGLLVDVSGVARKVVGYVDHEAETGR